MLRSALCNASRAYSSASRQHSRNLVRSPLRCAFPQNSQTYNHNNGRFCIAARSSASVSNDGDNRNNNNDNKKKKKKNDNLIASKVKVYMDLSKFRLSSLVVFTTAAGFLSAGGPVAWDTMLYTCFGTAFCAASASTFNQILEVERDGNMNRTKARPLPSKKATVGEATALGMSTGALGAALLYSTSHPLTAALGVANIGLYSGVYTYMKPKSEWNTWVGSLVGAIPPVMGYVAATGGQIANLEPALLGSILFLWQFPHFFALSWMHREDYARGGFQMVSTNDADGSRSADLILRYSLYLSALPVLSSVLGVTTYMFAVEGTCANAYLLYLSHRFHKDHSNANARRIFLCSLWYLPVLLAGFVLHSKSWSKNSVTARAEATDEDHAISFDFDKLITAITDYGKKACFHEMVVVNSRDKEGNTMCVKIGAESAMESVAAPVACDGVSDKKSDNKSAKS